MNNALFLNIKSPEEAFEIGVKYFEEWRLLNLYLDLIFDEIWNSDTSIKENDFWLCIVLGIYEYFEKHPLELQRISSKN